MRTESVCNNSSAVVHNEALGTPETVSGGMTTTEAAAYLKVKPRTLLKWVREGAIKAYPLHGKQRHVWRFHREDLDLALGFKKPVSSTVVNLRPSSVVRMRKGGSL